MKTTAFTIAADGQLQPILPEQVTDTCSAPDARTWLDLQGLGPLEIATWLGRLGVDGLARRICLEAADRAGFYPLRNEMVLVVPVMVAGKSGTMDHVVYLCRENLLLTMHAQQVLEPHKRTSVDTAAEWLPESTPVGLVATTLFDATQECLTYTSVLRTAIDTLEERLEHDPDSVQASDITDLRADLLAHEMIVSDQLPPVLALAGADQPGVSLQGVREFLNCALANLQAADRRIDRLDSRIGELRTTFQMHAQDKTNRRLGMLTILSAIFMPITLMAGIWGMNFAGMPELEAAYGYPLALGGMAVVAVGMLLFFRRGGWFG